jgi:uncharacterized membrane protein YphA (DoxX/SURF4 family)
MSEPVALSGIGKIVRLCPPASATSSSGRIASTGARPAALGFAAALLLLTGATLLLLGRRGKEYVAPRHR